MKRHSFHTMWHHFLAIYGDGKVESVGKKIGGKVQYNIELGIKDPKAGFTNACAIRMSYSLNHSGVPIAKGSWKSVSGKDNRQYIYRVTDLLQFLNQKWGKPDKTIKQPRPENFADVTGLLVFAAPWRDASGHATLWNGAACSDHCYFPNATEASVWLLK